MIININLFNDIFLVNLFDTFVISVDFFVKRGSHTNSIVGNPINIHNSFAFVFIFTKPSIYVFILFVDSIIKVSIIASFFNVGFMVNFLVFFCYFIAFASFFVESSIIINLRATNLIVNIYGSFILVFILIKSFINIFITFISSIVYAGLVFNLTTNVLSPIKTLMKLTSNTIYKD